MNTQHRKSATKNLEQIPIPKRKRIWKKNLHGLVFGILGIGMVVMAGVIGIKTGEFGMVLLTLVILGLGTAMYGSHIFSSQYSDAAKKWVIGFARDGLTTVKNFKKGDEP